MANYSNLLAIIDQWGLRDVLIPFVIIFTIIFATLQKLKIFKKKDKEGKDTDEADKKINLVLATGLASASMVPHFTGRGFDVVVFIHSFLPNSFLLLFVVLLFMALMGTVSDVSGKKPQDHPLLGLVAIVAVFSLAVILLQSAQLVNYPALAFLSDPNTQAIAIVILVFILVIWYISKKDETKKPEEYFSGFKKILENAFGK